jgi:hypothetical protein
MFAEPTTRGQRDRNGRAPTRRRRAKQGTHTNFFREFSRIRAMAMKKTTAADLAIVPYIEPRKDVLDRNVVSKFTCGAVSFLCIVPLVINFSFFPIHFHYKGRLLCNGPGRS